MLASRRVLGEHAQEHLAPRTRSSHKLSEPPMRTSGSKAALERKQLLVSLSILKFAQACRNADELRNRDKSTAQQRGAAKANDRAQSDARRSPPSRGEV